jgi:hypothetical protein
LVKTKTQLIIDSSAAFPFHEKSPDGSEKMGRELVINQIFEKKIWYSQS